MTISSLPDETTMTSLRSSFTLRFLLTLSCVFVRLHWSLVSCNLQHDPGRSLDAGLHDTKAVIGKYFNYSIPDPTVKLAEHKFHYEVSEVGTSSIPMWLVFNHTSHTFHGVPLITDKGFYLIKVSLISTFDNVSSVQAKDVFAIDVDFGASQDLTKKDILGSVGARPHQMLYKVEQLSEHITCRRNEIKTLMSVVFDANINHLNGSSRMSLITRLAPFVNQPLEEFSMSSKHSSVIDRLQKNIVVAAGPGNIHSAGSNEGVVVSWPLPCATQSLINQFPNVMARNIASGHLRDTTGYDVISWYISKARDSSVKARGRSKREAGMTIAPTPKPSQTASVITATSLLSISSTAQSMQTMLTSSVVSTLLFSPSSSDQTMSVFSSSMSGFVLSTTPLDFSSRQISLYSPSESLHTLTSIGTESIQPSLSQLPFMTSLSTSFLLPTTVLFSSSMQISLLSPTSQQRQTLYTSYQTPMSSTVESSKSTIGFVSSSLLMSSNVISPSTSAFPSFQSTNVLVSSPSLFQSTKIMSTSLLVTESPSMSSDESVQVSSTTITSVMLYSQSTASMMLATSSEIDISSVFSSGFLTTLLSSDSATTVILQTSSGFRSRSLLPSTEFSRMSSPILSSTLVGTSEFERRSSFSFTTTEISTLPQTPSTSSGSTLPPMQSSFSSQMLTTSRLSSDITPSSTGSVQTSSGLTSTSHVETNSGGSITPILSTETLLSSQIQSSFFSTMIITTPYQTEVTSRLVTTTLSSSEILLTQDVSTASTVFLTSHSPSEIQSSEIVQSMTPTAIISPSITESSIFSASPGTSSTASPTSTVISVLDTSTQRVPSTMEMTSESQSETPTSSFFGTLASQQLTSSSSAIIGSSFLQSNMQSSTVVRPSISSSFMSTSFIISPSTQYSSTTQTVYSLKSSVTPDLPSSFSDSRTTSVPSLMTSSVPVTESLVSTLSPQLSTSSEVMSTSVPSRFFSSTQEIVMSSSPSPTSSSSVPSTPGVLPSTTIMLSSSPAFPQTSSTAGRTSVLPSLPSSDVSLPMSTLLVSTSDIQPTPSYSSQVGVVSTSVVTTQPATTTTETTTEPENQAPIIQHPIDEICVALGDILQFSIPEDTFLDPEDGLTFDLQLDLLTTDNQPVSLSNWLQLVNNQQTLAGVPLDSNLTIFRNEYLLSATDSEGLVAYDAFVVKVQKRSLEYNHEFVITLENDFQSFVDDSQNIVSLCGDVASFLKDQNTDAFSVASLSEGSVVMTYSNKTIPTKYCDYETIDNLFSRLAYLNGTPTNAFQDALLPNNAITDIERIFLNLCSVTTEPPVTNVTESSVTGTNLLLVTVLPASLVSFLLLICFLIFCCCYKRKRGGEEFLLREEKPIYAKNRKPIYLDGELNDIEPRGASHPVILPIDVDAVKSSRPFKRKPHKPSSELRPPPPQYRLPDYAQVNLGFDDFENNMYEMEPPTYTSQPVFLDAADSKSLDDRPSPLYRLPPPYQSQDRGFFEESDI
eukprot:XP_011671719.1 PREDICTED: mucin-17 isoform X2 [Strongylocentrotus purpuratus]